MPTKVNEFDISVIVPVYNVEEYLIECLDSINNQTKDNIQVILIDDGSPDNSGKMADEYCKTHPNFECHHIENGGLGHARNYALQFVKGKYVTYIDSDDIVESNTYEVMFNAAERNGVDMVSCHVKRFNSKGISNSALHESAFNPIEKEVTHITEDLSLVNDVIACNKLVRADFIREHNFKFGENMLYEDTPAIMPMHCLAKKVAVVKTTAYLWRVRDGISTSITQNISDLKSITDRIKALKMVDEFFKVHNVDPKVVRAKLIKNLESDLLIYVNNCKSVPDDLAYQVLEYVRNYIEENIDEEMLSSIHLLNKQKYAYVLKNDLEGLRKLLENQNNYHNSPVKEIDGKFYIDCSNELFTVKDRDITSDIKKAAPKKYINLFSRTGSLVKLNAHAYLSRVNIPTSDEQEVEAFLINDNTAKTFPLTVNYYKNDTLTKSKGFVYEALDGKKSQYNYDGTGFQILINTAELDIPEDNLGNNHVLIKYKNRVKNGNLLLGNASTGTKEKLIGTTVISGNNKFEFSFDQCEQIVVNIEKIHSLIESEAFEDNILKLSLSNAANSVFLQNAEGEKSTFKRIDDTHFDIDLSSLGLDTAYDFYSTDEEGNYNPLYCIEPKTIIEQTVNGTAYISSLKDNKPCLIIAPTLSLITKITKQSPTRLTFSTVTYTEDDIFSKVKQVSIGFNDNITMEFFTLGKKNIASSNKNIHANISLNFKDKNVTKNLHILKLPLYLKFDFNDGKSTLVPLYMKKIFNAKLNYDNLWVRFFTLGKNEAHISTWQTWDEKERIASKRRLLIAEKYEAYRKLPIKNRRILFEAYWGQNYSCNPRAIYEYINEHYPEYECIWALNDPRHPINGNAKRVRKHSLKYYYYLATSKYFINNTNFPDAYIKREGQIEVHTMHGTPLKTHGLDVKDELPTEKEREIFINRTSRWNYVVVQGKFTAGKIKDCYGVEPEIMRTGYPRSDSLYNVSKERIAEIKRSLNIPEDKKVVLYTPTFRVRNTFDMQLDIENFRKKLGDDYVLLVRIHYMCAKGYKVPADNKVIFDMATYHSVENLFLIADILITDYSSVMFDYAILKKPMIFYIYDVKEYAGNLRGTYFDIEKEAPGPIAYNNEQLVNAISNIDEEMKKCGDRVQHFYDTYVNYECENSTQKVVEILLKERNSLANKFTRVIIPLKRSVKSVFCKIAKHVAGLFSRVIIKLRKVKRKLFGKKK